MFVDGKLTHAPAELPPQIEIFTLRDSVPGQTYIISADQCRVDTDGFGRVLANADILATTPSVLSEYVRVINMNEGFVVDMFTQEAFRRPLGFERLHDPSSFPEQNWRPVVGYITNAREFEQLAELYRSSFGAELTYAVPSQKSSLENALLLTGIGKRKFSAGSEAISRARTLLADSMAKFIASKAVSRVVKRSK